MRYNEKRAYLKEIQRRYKRSTRPDKTKILDEFCEICGYNRKYAVRLIKGPAKRKKLKRGRQPWYRSEAFLKPLRAIWLASDQLCSKRLKVALPEWLPYYEQEQGILADTIRSQLLKVSSSTIDRVLKNVRVKYPRRGLSGTKPGRLLKNQIPIKTDHWDVTMPGFMEADTVAHCGNSLAGSFVWSLTLTDILTTWTENRATWNKGSAGVCDQIKDIEEGLPFELLGFDCDNGSEFLNHHILSYFTQRSKVVQFTRSRPYRKNDNAHVEQKNWTHVRNLFGYDRFEKPSLVALMNKLYKNEWSLYQNHFCPTTKLVEKKKINSRYYKRYDTPATPYQRVLACHHVSQEIKADLQRQHQRLNPFALKRSIEAQLKVIFKLVSVTSFMSQRL